MTHEDKQLLLDAARAIGHPDPRISEGEWLETRYGLTCAVHFSEPGRRAEGGYWNPLEDDGDCARMCDELLIDIRHLDIGVDAICDFAEVSDFQSLSHHNNNRSAARRYVACRIAAEIWRTKK